MKKISALVLVLWTMVASMSAIPADRRPHLFTQPDGSTVTLILQGDETFNFLTTTDGMPVVQDADGTYRYAQLSGSQLVAGRFAARDENSRSAEEQAYLLANGHLLKSGAQIVWQQRNNLRNGLVSTAVRRAPAEGGPRRTAYTGQKRGLCILVQFSDVKFSAGGTQAEFNNMFNQTGYSKNGHIGSVHDYFYDQSYGQFDLEFDVVGPVQLKYTRSYYGQDGSGNNIDLKAGDMIVEACQGVADQVNFKDYDWDNNGEVDQLYVLYAGHGQNVSGVTSDAIWPHEYWLKYSSYGKRLYLNGMYIDTYSCGSELKGNSGTNLGGIGVVCHEYSHCLGLPDFYDVSYSGAFGMDKWSVMGDGAYCGDGCIPSPYTSYERMVSGWLTPTVLSTPKAVVDMQPITDAPEAYIIYNDANKNEYYMLENHQVKSWGKDVNSHGLLVLHVDYSSSAWEYNTVNNDASHERMTIIPADNSLSNGGYVSSTDLGGDPFPGLKKKTALTDTSIPAATLYNRSPSGNYLMGKPIEKITETNTGLISFSFMGGVPLNPPTALDATDVKENAFTANWEEVEEADSYNLQYRTLSGANPSEKALLEEDFALVEAGSDGNDGAFDVSSNLNNLTAQEGWTGSKLYNSAGRIKLGTASRTGWIATPVVAAPADGKVTVHFDQEVYGSETEVYGRVALMTAAGDTIQSQQVTFTGKGYALNFDGVSQDFKAYFGADKRIYLDNIGVYAGTFSEDDFAGLDAWKSAPIIENIAATSYVMQNLTAPAYVYRVQSVSKDGASEWSNEVAVALPTGIEHVLRDNFTEDAPVEIYTLDGRCVTTCRADQKPTLPAGIYLFRQGNQARKVLVK